MPTTIQTWLNFALQQMAAESYLDQVLSGRSFVEVLNNGNNNEDVIPINQFTGKTRFVDLTGVPNANHITGSAQAYEARYNIIDHHANDSTGFSATLMKDRNTGEYTLSFRSLEYQDQDRGGDWERDGLEGAAGEVATQGFAFGQLISMERYYRELKTDTNKLPPNAVLNVTGYSLGGHLATIFTELHQADVNQAYVFNGAGRGRIEGFTETDPVTLAAEETQMGAMLQRLEQVLFDPNQGLTKPGDELLSAYLAAKQAHDQDPSWNPLQSGVSTNLYTDPRYHWATTVIHDEFETDGVVLATPLAVTGGAFDKIVQLYGQAVTGDTTVVANSGLHASAEAILIEGQPVLEDILNVQDRFDFGNTHSLTLLVDSLSLQELFQQIDPNLQQPQIEVLFQAASASKSDLLTFTTDTDAAEGNTLEKTLDALRKLVHDPAAGPLVATSFGNKAGDFGSLTFRNSFYSGIQEVRTALAGQTFQIAPLVVRDAQGNVAPVFTATQLQGLAQTDIAYRYALRELNPFAVVGVDYAELGHAAGGRLDLFNPTTGDGELTTDYLADRAAFLLAKLDLTLNNQTTPSDPYTLTHYHDVASGFDVPAGISALSREYLFGGDQFDTLDGSHFLSTDDHLYGGGGDDRLFGQGGTDYLEGGKGDDTLDGGRGADRLVGGADNDTYYVDAAGDQVIETASGGTDTIISSASKFVLADHVENMTVAGGVLGQGNDLENELRATSVGAKLFGGQGNDRYVVTVDKTQVLESAGEGTDTVESAVSITLGANVETLVLTGQSAIDGTGNDQNNTLFGNSAGNLLMGGGGQDHLLGGAATDILVGGAGDDLLEGGADADVYVYRTGDGVDRIEDTEGQNVVIYDGQMLQGGLRAKDDAPNTYTSLDGRLTFLKAGGDLIVNSTLILNEDFQDGQFGIRLVDEVDYTNGLPTRTNADYVNQDSSRTPIVNDDPQSVVLAGDPVSSGNPGGFNLSIHALGGNDIVSAFGDGNDELFGDEGDDWLIGSGGDDRLDGGEGNDLLDGDSVELSDSTPGRDRLEGGAGNDKLIGKEHADILLGGTGNDEMYGDGGNEPTWDASEDDQDLLDGGEGNDILYGGGGNDVLTGGEDDDSLWGDYGETVFDAIGGADTLDGGAGHDGLVGGGGVDRLFGGDGNDLLIGDSPIAGNQVVGANDVLSGGDGNDDLIGQGGDDTLQGGDGNDSLWGDNQGNSFLGTANDSLDGGSGNDSLYGEQGRDFLEGGDDNDVLLGGDEDDQLTGGTGSDALIGDDSINGRALSLSVAPGTDTIDGGEGNDTLSGSGGNDRVVGGSGSDVLFGDDWTFDPFVLGTIDNPFVGGPVRIVLGSAPGDDTLDGGEGSDVLFGGAGNDTLLGGVGTDYLFGDLGLFSDAGGNDTLDGGEGDDHLSGGAGNDILRAGAGDDYLVGGDGDDQLEGSDGDDTLVGGAGTNTLLGGAGNDQLSGDEGDDLLDAGAGDDVMRGGGGSDSYLFGRGSGRDLVVNQSFDGADTIRLAADVALDDVAVARDRDNLVLRLQGGSDQMTVENYFQDVFNQVAFVEFADGTSWDAERIKDLVLTGSGQGGKLQGFGDRNDAIVGTEGSQMLAGLAGDDTLDGGTGQDTLKGGGGSDTYRFAAGSGADTLFDRAGDADTVQMGSGILPGDVAVLKNGIDLVLQLQDTGDSLAVSNFFANSSFQVEQVAFEDGTMWDQATLQSLAQPFQARASGADIPSLLGQTGGSPNGPGQEARITFDGQAAGDVSVLADDLPMDLVGTDGMDVLVGGTGADHLDGGAGNDYLYGFEGNDTYLFGVGSGQDIVLDYDQTTGNIDTIQLVPGVSSDQIGVARIGDDLVLDIAGTGDRLTLQSFLLGSAYHVERVAFDDGTVWDAGLIRDKARAVTNGTGGNDVLVGQGNGAGLFDDLVVGASGSDTLMGDAGTSTQLSLEGQDKLLGGDGNDRLMGGGDTDVLDGGAGDDRLYGDAIYSGFHFDNAGPSLNPGNDILLGGDGNDILNGQRGDDVLDGGADADVLNGEAGSDTLLGGAGDDTLYGDVLFSAVRGNDTLDGGEGNDTLIGGAGADTYVFGRGYGQDIVVDNDFSALPQVNTIRLASDLAPADVTLQRAVDPSRQEMGPGDLVLALNDSSDQLVLQGFFSGFKGNFFQVQFGDGTVWDAETMAANAGFTVAGTADADLLLAYDQRDVLEGLEGSDTLMDNGLAATLAGGQDDDTYRVTIETATIDESADEGTDQVESLVDYVLPANVENLTLLDTEVWGILPDGSFGPDPELNAILGTGNELDNVLIGNSGMNILSGGAGNDTLYGSHGGGGGGEGGGGSTADNDFLIGGAGNDTYLFTRGNGVDTIVDTNALGEGNRVLFGEDITSANLIFTQDQNRLTITLAGAGEGEYGEYGEGGEEGGYFGEEGEYGEGEGSGNGAQDAVILLNFDPNRVNGSLVVERLEFSDGGFINMADLFPSTEPVPTEGDDVLTYGSDDDIIDALGGHDVVDADGGNDTIFGGAGNDTLDGGAGDDQLFGNSGNDALTGGEGNDSLYGEYAFDIGDTPGNDILDGGAGNDTLVGGGGADELRGGDGDDSLVVDGTDTVIDGGAGLDTVTVQGTAGVTLDLANVETVFGGVGNDLLLNSAPASQVASLYVAAGDGDDVVVGGAASDQLYGQAGNDQLTGNEGNDYIEGGTGTDTLDGGAGDDQLFGNSGNDALTGGEGNDSLYGEYAYDIGDIPGNDLLDGGAGNDRLFGNGGDDVILGGEGNDELRGDEGNDVLEGALGDDVLTGGTGADIIRAGDGNDWLVVDGEDTEVDGGAGFDTVNVQGTTGATLNLSTLEQVFGGAGNDVFATSTPDQLVNLYADGGAGDDSITGGAGDDQLFGRAGNDSIVGGAGNDSLSGEHPYDVGDGPGNDFLAGGDGSDTLIGGSGDDTLSGDDGDDVLYGDYTSGPGSGNDVLVGGAGADQLVGGAGDDTLVGGTGDDTLAGGTGDDAYYYNLGDGLDRITDLTGDDTVHFGAGISAGDTVVRLEDAAGILNAHLRLLDEFGNELADQGLDFQVGPGGESSLEQIVFADGTTLLPEDLIVQTVVTRGTKHADVIRTGKDDDIIYALNGGDTVYSGSGNDTVYAGKGGDRVYGEGGNDALYGESGRDFLDGGYGNDLLDGDKGDDKLLGGEGDDRLFGGQGEDKLDGGGGHDHLEGGEGEDRLSGGAGDDVLLGGKGEDCLQGGAGNDVLDSGKGDDTILFGRGDGQDRLVGRENNHDDTVRFGADVNPLDLILSRQADDLRVSIYGTSDQLTIQGWYADRDNRVDEFRAGCGQELEDSKVNQLIQAMAGFTARTGLTWEQGIAQRPQDVQSILAASWR